VVDKFALNDHDWGRRGGGMLFTTTSADGTEVVAEDEGTGPADFYDGILPVAR
jgi:hypothetical protein